MVILFRVWKSRRKSLLTSIYFRCYNVIDHNTMSFGEIEIAASVCTMQRYVNQVVLVDDERKMLHKINVKNSQMFAANAIYYFYLNAFIVLAGYLFFPVYDIVQ